MNEPAYLTPKEVHDRLKDARCTSCKQPFTEKDFETKDGVIVINQIVDDVVPEAPRMIQRLAHWDCWFKPSGRPSASEALKDALRKLELAGLTPLDAIVMAAEEEE